MCPVKRRLSYRHQTAREILITNRFVSIENDNQMFETWPLFLSSFTETRINLRSFNDAFHRSFSSRIKCRQLVFVVNCVDWIFSYWQDTWIDHWNRKKNYPTRADRERRTSSATREKTDFFPFLLCTNNRAVFILLKGYMLIIKKSKLSLHVVNYLSNFVEYFTIIFSTMKLQWTCVMFD